MPNLASFIQLVYDIDTVKLYHFTKWDRDWMTELESIFTKITLLFGHAT